MDVCNTQFIQLFSLISSAGHVEANHSITRTAQLELAEELGLDNITEDELQLSFIIPAEQSNMGGCNAYEHVYFLILNSNNETNSISQFALGIAEVSEVAWKPVKDVLNALRNNDEEYALRTQQYVDAMEKELNRILLRE